MSIRRTPSYPSESGGGPRQTLLPIDPQPELASEPPLPSYVTDDDSKLRSLEVKVRGTARADGTLEQRLVVFCPESNSNKTIDECARCSSFESMSLDPRDRSSFLTCRIGAAERMESSSVERWSLGAPGHSLPEVSIPEPSGRTPVSEIMTKNPITVSPEMSLEGLTLLLLDRGLSGVPVVDETGECVGVVSKTDLVRHIHERGATSEEPVVLRSEERGLELELGPGFHVERVMSACVRDVMTPVAFSVRQDSPVAQAAALMVYEGIHRLPVLSDDGLVVGLVSSMDVMRWISQRAGYVSAPARGK